MTDSDRLKRAAFTRRDYLKGGSALVGGGLLAGCTGESSPGSGANGSNGSESGGATSSGDGGTTASGGSESSYSATMAPAGTVEFSSVPKNVMVYSLLYADMMVAYGHGGAVNSLGFSAESGGNTLDAYYARLDGVSFDQKGLTQLKSGGGSGSGQIMVDKEQFYKLDSDLHLVDPALVASFKGWNTSDIGEIRENIAPWFGNNYSRDNTQPPKPYRGNYQYYTLWQLAEKVSKVFQREKQFEKLSAIHDNLINRIQSNLPPKTDRPSVGALLFMDGTFYPSKINTPGFGNAHVRPFKAVDAFTTSDIPYGTSYDFEKLLEVDPDIILHQYGIASYYNVNEIRKTLQNNAIGSQLTAIQNDRFYPSGNPTQGPIMNLFQLEMTAKQLYPKQFGEWPGYAHGNPYPEIPNNEQLFDRQRVADIITGTS
jgi:ABC-type Fe3+-hydroxamate transport system substrate-binding protein